MSRVASVLLLLGGTILSVTWLVSTAVSAPQTQSPRQTRPSPATSAPSITDSSVDPIRLDATTGRPPVYTQPRRDPFSFQSREPRVVVPTPPTVAMPVREPVRLPVLVAVLKDTRAGSESYRAVLSQDTLDVTIVSTGATFGAFTIAEVRSDVVLLRDTRSGDVFRLPLR
jgi:hypothetical protein